MDASQIITLARRLGYVDSNNYTTPTAVIDMNIAYHYIENIITTEVWEDFFWNTLTSDTVIGQYEYALPDSLIGNYTSLYKTLSVLVKYDDEYVKLRPVLAKTLERDFSWYSENQPVSDPFFVIADKSVFVFPAPKTVVDEWLKLYSIQNIADIDETTTEAELFAGSIPTKFHTLIAYWMVENIFRGRGMINEAAEARARFMQDTSKLVEFLSDREDGVLLQEKPDLSYYK